MAFLLVLFALDSRANDKLAEITFGKIWTEDDQFLELGLDLEYFPSHFNHKISFGLASEIEFEKKNEFYTGPLLSIYLNQLKVFMTSGLQGHNSYWRVKSRLGVGYDFHLPEDYILIPNFTVDFIDSEVHQGLSLGIAKEF